MGADIWLFCEVHTTEQGKRAWFPVELEGWEDLPWEREGLVLRE